MHIHEPGIGNNGSADFNPPDRPVYFFSMATSFTRAALGAEGVGADVDLRIGNGYTEGHAELSLGLLRESELLRKIFTEQYT